MGSTKNPAIFRRHLSILHEKTVPAVHEHSCKKSLLTPTSKNKLAMPFRMLIAVVGVSL